MVRPIAWYEEHAPDHAQEVINAWGVNCNAGNSKYFTEDFKRLLEPTFRYWEAKRTAAHKRRFGLLTEHAEAEEKSERLNFAQAYKEYREKCEAVESASHSPTFI